MEYKMDTVSDIIIILQNILDNDDKEEYDKFMSEYKQLVASYNDLDINDN